MFPKNWIRKFNKWLKSVILLTLLGSVYFVLLKDINIISSTNEQNKLPYLKLQSKSGGNIKFTFEMDFHTKEILPKRGLKVNDNGKKEVLIFTTMRSGSSFLGEMFNRNDDFMYMFEPLRLHALNVTGYETINQKADIKWKKLFDCNIDEFVNKSRQLYGKSRGEFIKEWRFNSFCWKLPSCHGRVPLDLFCSKKKHVAIKEILVRRINLTVPLLNEGVFVIHLLRDPRAIVNSIQQIEPNLVETNDQLNGLCLSLKEQVEYSLRHLHRKYSNYMLIRFEDITPSPDKFARYLYKFIGLKLPEKVTEWIKMSTTANNTVLNLDFFKKRLAFSTKRDSKSVATDWRRVVSWETVNYLQQNSDCLYVITTLGYQMFKNVNELRHIPNHVKNT